MMILGLDIGGANTKAASADGSFVESMYLPLWKGCDLEGALESISKKAKRADAVGVTITGELADCYGSKKEGVERIAGEVKKVFPQAVFYGIDGEFHSDVSDYRLFSAANWSASAMFIGAVHKSVILIDIGSTTTDIIPIVDGVPAAGLTDFERLSRGELIYAGALRTNVAALLQKAELRGKAVRTSSELFAITGDVNLLLGNISEDDYTCDAPDGGPKSREGAALRMARVVCCDLEEMTVAEAVELARQAYRKQVDDLKDGIAEVAGRHGLKGAVVCGMGDFIGRDALAELGMPFTLASIVYSKPISRVFPAFAVARLLSANLERS
ncbi:hydantoinase/oxoprolinase family protein [Methanocella conradii]|uniref:hydantoinase/oxoprolinase family protein n=1 Tax=Methanocella conradii TaxID=1175444 RepID=UPI0020C6B358|nr:hydantoinase/oxoprolinase family protein [Methanocella conradii]